mmetsp:Transcript_81573/g.144505  ORF Transcript_81573/g.144505 Transcript_81573/m.144505 type:complete len:334 (+) Transcript_81573:66-1067(+)
MLRSSLQRCCSSRGAEPSTDADFLSVNRDLLEEMLESMISERFLAFESRLASVEDELSGVRRLKQGLEVGSKAVAPRGHNAGSRQKAQDLEVDLGEQVLKSSDSNKILVSLDEEWQPTVTKRAEELCRLDFAVELGDVFGLHLTETQEPEGNSHLVVVEREPKSLFGRTRDGNPGVVAGDTIIEVNGKSGSASYLHDLLQQASVSGCSTIALAVQTRPAAFDVVLERKGSMWQKLGLEVAIDKKRSDLLIVMGVRSEGLVPQWNVDHSSLRICKGDHITHVNEITQDARSMCLAIQHADEESSLTFRVVTPCNPRMPRLTLEAASILTKSLAQ